MPTKMHSGLENITGEFQLQKKPLKACCGLHSKCQNKSLLPIQLCMINRLKVNVYGSAFVSNSTGA